MWDLACVGEGGNVIIKQVISKSFNWIAGCCNCVTGVFYCQLYYIVIITDDVKLYIIYKMRTACSSFKLQQSVDLLVYIGRAGMMKSSYKINLIKSMEKSI